MNKYILNHSPTKRLRSHLAEDKQLMISHYIAKIAKNTEKLWSWIKHTVKGSDKESDKDKIKRV